jgi:acetylglutamate kinase
MDDRELVKNLLRDVVFLELVGIKPILVHGGGKAISAAMQEAGMEATFVSGLRITTDESMELVETTLSSRINPGLVKDIEHYGGKALGIPGHTAFIGERLTGWSEDDNKEVSLGRVGKIIDFDLSEIEAAVKANSVPVISPIAREKGTGLSLNVNADLAASALACKLQVAKLVYLSDVIGVMEDPSKPETLIHTIKADSVEDMISDGVIGGGMIPKLRSSVEALEAGVGKVHMIDGRVPHTLLLEIFTKHGIGTEIVK